MPFDTEPLAALPLFNGLSSSELEEIAIHLEVMDRPAATQIIKEGDTASQPLYVLLSGAVEVIKRGLDGRGHVISVLSAPSVFGEIEVLARRPAIAGVTATTPVKLALLRRGAFDEMCAAGRPAALKVVRNLAQVLSYRLAATDERLAAQFDLSVPAFYEKVKQLRHLIYSGWRSD